MNPSRLLTALALALATMLGRAFAENFGGTAADRAGDERIHVLAPLEGSTVSDSTIRVAFEVSKGSNKAGPRRKASRPEIYVFLDDILRAKTTDWQTELKLDGVTPGSHEVVLFIKSPTGAIIARKEVHFAAVASGLDASSSRPPSP